MIRQLIRIPPFAFRFLTSAIDSIAFSILSDEEIEELTLRFYEASASSRADSANFQGLFAWELRAIEEHFPEGGKLLLTSAGGGREALALAASHGWSLTATECCTVLADDFQRRVASAQLEQRITVRHLPAWLVPLDAAPYDAAIIGWGGYSHVRTVTRRVSFLESVRAALAPGAPLLVSFLAAEKRGAIESFSPRLSNVFRRLSGKPPIELGDTFHDTCFRHFFRLEELEEELRSAGFENVVASPRPYGHAVARNRTSAGGLPEVTVGSAAPDVPKVTRRR